MKSKILALSVVCAIGSATQAMEDRIESRTLLTFENKTEVTARVTIVVKGRDDIGYFHRSIDDFSMAPKKIYNFKVSDLPEEFTYPDNRKQPMTSSYSGLVSFNEVQPHQGGVQVEWKNVYNNGNIIFIFNEEKNKYEVNKR